MTDDAQKLLTTYS